MAGKAITDHKFFAGSGSPKFPKGVHTKDESPAVGAGSLSHYEDTTETIKSQQMMGTKKIHAHSQKAGHRN
jgi:hypothetical protein